jgi:ribosomal protein S18 acetylase RimI-like enzyme
VTPALIDRLQQFLRLAAANGNAVVPMPPFTAFLHERDPLKYFNYAVPDGDVEPTADDVARLRAAFHERDRLPRLEWVEECAPRVAPVLAHEGMVEELRAPLMGCTPARLVEAGADLPDLTIRPVGDADLWDVKNVQRPAFGQPRIPPDDDPGDPRLRGGGSVLARSAGDPVAAATWTAVIDGVSEVAGVATVERWRRRGLAGAVTAAAAREAFAAGAELCVISPGGEEAQRVYERAGFRRMATMLHWSDDRG